MNCSHQEVRLGKHLINNNLNPDKFYCLEDGEEIEQTI